MEANPEQPAPITAMRFAIMPTKRQRPIVNYEFITKMVKLDSEYKLMAADFKICSVLK